MRTRPVVRSLAVAFAALAVVQAAGPMAAAPAPGRRVAVTFDDLPYVAVESADFVRDARRVAEQVLRVLRAHHAPAVAFVNEGKLQATGEVDARVAVLKTWCDAGVLLGNHTYSHADFNAMSVAQFEGDIVRGETVTRRLMQARTPYQLYFRFPETHTGDTIEKKTALETYLTGRGYRITPHTIENSDFVFNVPYVRSRRAGNAATAAKIADAYVAFTFAATAFAEEVAPKIFGRDIPQTLLIHANDITADTLDRLLTGFEARGYRFITLDEAMADAAYRTPDTLVTRAGPTWLWRWMKSKGLNVSFKDDPEPPAWVSQLYADR